MNRIIFLVSLVSLAALFTCSNTQKNPSSEVPKPPPTTETSSPAGLRCLLEAYSDFLEADDGNSIRWKDGTKMVFDDGKAKPNYETMLDQASLKDQMSACYPKEMPDSKSFPINYDPGRARHEPFFHKMYGSTSDEVRQKLVPVIWLPKNIRQTILVTTINGIDKKISAISEELDKLPPEYMRYLSNPGGTFNWRVIAGTNRRSTHSFGMTIDINVKSSDYWRYNKPDKTGRYVYKNRIPLEIVEVFEKQGFIWGGKWYHFDTMHFEYRPELLKDACLCTKGNSASTAKN
jgi:peptidoglycan LD-endopeptidase CwlK